jgi:hypothetical protein
VVYFFYIKYYVHLDAADDIVGISLAEELSGDEADCLASPVKITCI